MVKRFLVVSVLFLLVAGFLFADFTFKGGAEVGGVYVHLSEYSLLTEKNLRGYLASPYIGGVYSASNLRSEFKLSFSYINVKNLPKSYNAYIPAPSWSVDKAFVRFRIPSFNDSKLTFIVGKSPVSWGMGHLYRGGDTLFSNPISNEEAGEETEKNLWILSVSQPIGRTTVNLSFVPVLESQFTNEKIGAMASRDFDSDYLKEIRASYVYEFEADYRHKASLLLDMNIGFDLNLCLESQFRDKEDLRLVLNAMKTFTIDTESRSISIAIYVSGQGDVYNDTYDLSEVITVDVTDRTSLTVMNTNNWSSGEYKIGSVMASTSTTLADGVSVNVYGLYYYKGTGAYSGLSILSYDTIAGVGIEYKF